MEHDIKMPERKTYAVPLFLSGAVIGAVAAMLLAPDSGKETRRKMGVWLKEQKQKMKGEPAAIKEALEAGKKAFKEKLSAV